MYIAGGGKRLRPAILLWSCGAVGGDLENAIPAAAAVEVFHTWTLVHDDIIDRDDRRRGNESVHVRFQRLSKRSYRLLDDEALHYGTSVAILAGDVQHGWNVSLLTELTREKGLPAELTLRLIRELSDKTINGLIEGELLDLQFTRLPAGQPSPDQIVDMLRKKTGELYRFCAWAGALIGLGANVPDHPHVNALASFAEKCGLAFQMQDDILGVIGDPGVTGKPVGNDIREGKRTLVVHHAWERADSEQRQLFSRVLGNADASDEDIDRVTHLLHDLGAVQHVQRLAQDKIQSALPALDSLPSSRYRDLLASWADFIISRNV
jgi:geranylgeranyl diphosphate synthase type I